MSIDAYFVKIMNRAEKKPKLYVQVRRHGLLLFVFLALAGIVAGQATQSASERAAAIEAGSRIAKGGFKNEDEIRDKFNNWKSDADARAWLAAMSYRIDEIETVTAAKPHGEKADVEVRIRTRSGEKAEGISIKLVSTATGFNQIDKRWLRQYVKIWKIPANVEAALKLFTGEVKPNKTSRNPERMFLNELDADSQKAVLDFFAANKERIVSDLIAGDGPHAARWMLVALKAQSNTRWVMRSTEAAAKFFGEGRVEITRAGNLKIGRITMQRKGGDGGRETANMLQFKINPGLLVGS